MDIATLGLAVDSRPVTAAAKALDTLADAGKRAEVVTHKVEASFDAEALAAATAKGAVAGLTAALDANSKAQRAEESASRAAAKAAKDAAGEQDALAASYNRTVIAITASVAGAALLVKGYIQVADSVTALNNQLKLATGSTEAAAKASAGLYEIAQRSRVNFIELGGTYASIARNAGEMGIAQSRVLKVTESIANAMTISGGSAQSMNAALVQLGQGMSSGVLRGEELNSVMEQAPRLAKALADGLGVPIGRLREMGAAGEITAQQVVKALESQSAVLAGEVSGATMTVAQSFVQLTNASTRAIGEFDAASGSSAALAAAISAGAGAVDTLGTAFKENSGVIQTVMGAIAGGAVLTTLGAIPSAITAVTAAVSGLSVVLAANPIVLALLGVGAIVGGGLAAVNAMSKTESGIKEAIRSLQDENERSEAALERAIAGGRTAGANNIRKAIDERKKAIRELNAELALSAPATESPAEDARFARSTAAKKADEAASRELAGIRAKLYKVDSDYLPTLQKLHQQYTDGRISLKEYRADVEALAKANYKAAPAAKSGVQQSVKDEIEAFKTMDAARKDYEKSTAESLKREIKAYEDYSKARDAAEAKTLDGYQKTAEAAAQRAAGLEDEATAAELSAQNNVSLGVAIEQVGLARARDAQTKALSEGLDGATLLALQREIEARERIIGLLSNKDARTAAGKAAQSASTEWERASNKIENDITGALMRGFEAGKGFAENMRDTVVNMFKTMVLEPTIRGVVSPVSGAVNSALGGASNALGLTGMSGMLGAGLKAGLSALTGEAGIMGALSAGTTAIGAGNILGGLGTLAGSLGPIAIGVGAILSALKGGEYVQSLGETVATVIRSTIGLSGSGGNNDVSIGGGLNIRQTEQSDKFVSGMASAFVKAATSLGIVASGATFGAGFNTSDGGKFAVEASAGGMKYDPGQVKTSDAALQLEASRAVFFALQSSELPGYLREVFDGVRASTATQEDINAALEYGAAVKKIRDELTETRTPLEVLRANVDTAFTELGTSAETFKADFVAAIDAGITTEQLAEYQALGRNLEELSKSAGATATVTATLADALTKLREPARTVDDVARSIVGLENAGKSLQIALMQAKGDVAGAAELQKALDTTGYTDAEKKLYDYNAALQAQIDAVNAANVAQAAHVEASRAAQAAYEEADRAEKAEADRIANERKGLQSQINALTDTNTEALARQRAALDESNRALFDQLQILTESHKAQEEAARVAKAAEEAEDRATEAVRNMTEQLTGEWLKTGVELLRAQGHEQLAVNAERMLAIQGYNAEQVALYDSTQAVRAHITELQKQAELQATIANELPAVLAAYQTPEQRTRSQYQGVADTLAGVGYQVTLDGLMAATKDQIAALAVSYYTAADTTDTARLAILRAAGALATLKDEAADAAKAAQDEADAKAATARANALTAATAATDAAYASLEREVGARRQVIQSAIDDTRAVFEAVGSAARELYGDVTSTSQAASTRGANFIANALQNALTTGYLPDPKDLQRAISDATKGVGQTVFATQFEADRSRLVLAGQLRQLEDASGEQLDVQEEQLRVLDASLEAARAQLDAMRGVDISVMGVDARIAALTAAITAERAARIAASAPAEQVITGAGAARYSLTTGTGTNSAGEAFTGAAITEAGRAALAAGQGRSVYDAVKASGFTLAQADTILQMAPGSAEDWARSMGLPVFHDGVDFVPQTGLALLQRGERVTRADQNTPIDSLIAGLMDKIDAMAGLIAMGNVSMAQLADQFDQVTEAGNAMRSETV